MLRKQKNQPTLFIFAIVGVVMIAAAAIWTGFQFDFLAHSEVTQGRVIDLVQHKSSKSGSTYAPLVEFKTEQNEIFTFTSRLYSGSPSYRVEEIVPVRYRITDPQNAEVDTFMAIWLGPIVLWILGIAFSFTGITLGSHIVTRNRVIKGLEVSNRKITAKITDIKQSNFGSKHSHPYLIYAEYEDGGKMFTFQSDPIPYDPTDMIKSPTITVLVDPSDMTKYYVDVDSVLPPKGGTVGTL